MATFTIRIPDGMRDRIKAAAEEDRRSMNSEIEWLLDSSLCRREILAEAAAAAGEHPVSHVCPPCAACGEPARLYNGTAILKHKAGCSLDPAVNPRRLGFPDTHEYPAEGSA